MTDLTSLTLAEARDRLRKREFSAVELAEAHLAAIEKARALNAYVLETPEQARAMAKARRCAARKRGEARPLEGIPLGIKDLFAPRACAPPPARTSSTISCRPTSRPSPRSSGATAR